MPMVVHYFYIDNAGNPIGPCTQSQIDDLFEREEGGLTEETLIWKEGAEGWVSLGEVPPNFWDTEDELQRPSKEEQSSNEEDRAKLEKSKAEIPNLLDSIQEDLDTLWECQRAAILARITGEKLSPEIKEIRRQSNDYYERIEDKTIECWRKDGQLLEWITGCLKKQADWTFPIPAGDDPDFRMNAICAWLQTIGLNDLKGCYCWKNNDRYLYVGQAGRLETRIKSYKTRDFFRKTTHIRIMIPHFKGCKKKRTVEKRKLNVLERLLLLQYQPEENRAKNGHKGHNEADNCLNYIMEEVRELATDADA